MSITVEQFGQECHDILKADPGRDGVEKVRLHLAETLKDQEFVEKYLGAHEDSNRKVIYEDPELKFCVLAHVQKGEAKAPPHDHGETWAIYGVGKGMITMNVWKKVAEPAGGNPGKAERIRAFDQNPGEVSAWHVGQLHSPSRTAEARLIRMEGFNLEGTPRDKYEPVEAANS
jgi:predicted metal-dependent enzyme (double-stranded beta helix superfamily)